MLRQHCIRPDHAPMLSQRCHNIGHYLGMLVQFGMFSLQRVQQVPLTIVYKVNANRLYHLRNTATRHSLTPTLQKLKL